MLDHLGNRYGRTVSPLGLRPLRPRAETGAGLHHAAQTARPKRIAQANARNRQRACVIALIRGGAELANPSKHVYQKVARGRSRDDAQRPHDVTRLARRGNRRLHAGGRGGDVPNRQELLDQHPEHANRFSPSSPTWIVWIASPPPCASPTDWMLLPSEANGHAIVPTVRYFGDYELLKRSPGAEWASSIRPGRLRSIAWSRSR